MQTTYRDVSLFKKILHAHIIVNNDIIVASFNVAVDGTGQTEQKSETS